MLSSSAADTASPSRAFDSRRETVGADELTSCASAWESSHSADAQLIVKFTPQKG